MLLKLSPSVSEEAEADAEAAAAVGVVDVGVVGGEVEGSSVGDL